MSGAVVGIGIDLVDVGELRELLEATGGASLETGWTAAEIIRCADRPTLLAATWAIKEAVMKAVGLGLGDIDPLDVSVDCRSDGSAAVLLSGNAATMASGLGVTSFRTSWGGTTHLAVATAFAIAGPGR